MGPGLSHYAVVDDGDLEENWKSYEKGNKRYYEAWLTADEVEDLLENCPRHCKWNREEFINMGDVCRQLDDFINMMENDVAKSTELDDVTILQIAEDKGLRFYNCQWLNNPRKDFTFKAYGIFEKDDLVVIKANDGNFHIVKVVDEACDFFPQEGVTYCWIVQRLDVDELNKYPKMDEEARRKLARARVRKRAQEYAALINADTINTPQIEADDD